MPVEFKAAITFAVIMLLAVLGALSRPLEKRNMLHREYRLWNWGAAIGLYGCFLSLLVALWRIA